jgi:endonuclease-3
MPAKTIKPGRSDSKTLQQRRQRVASILPILKRAYPQAKCSLNYSNPLELLVATILSAQCTDERVNQVTRELFGKYRTAADYARVPQQ